MRKLTITAACLLLVSLVLPACTTTAPADPQAKQQLTSEAENSLQTFINKDPSLEQRVDNAYGYVIFPSIGKGGAIIGGAFGRGVVYEGGDRVGYATVTQGTIGAQLGGQTFSQLILFENENRFERFKAEEFSFSAEVSAVAAKAGAAKKASYQNGVLVFVRSQGGLMAEASVGGQKFNFVATD
jgi:lipid-binding SYLF domain-containing protein